MACIANHVVRSVVSLEPNATCAEAAELMRLHHTRHLAVMEGGEMVGILSLLDLVSMVVEEKQWSIDPLESYVRGGRAAQLSTSIRPLFARTAQPAPTVGVSRGAPGVRGQERSAAPFW
jgi:CBS-domain-containing membrane protein